MFGGVGGMDSTNGSSEKPSSEVKLIVNSTNEAEVEVVRNTLL